ncbi:14254_t:CDS:2, partial [Racocetra persica]
SREKFNNFQFDVEFNSVVTLEKAEKIVFEKDAKYILTTSENIDNKPADIIEYPDIIEKLKHRD